jgi:hypothetical protein
VNFDFALFERHISVERSALDTFESHCLIGVELRKDKEKVNQLEEFEVFRHFPAFSLEVFPML